jgi:L-aspartate oxidase
MLATAKLIAAAALMRRESIGAHFRRDYPDRPGQPRRSFLTLRDAEAIADECAEAAAGTRERAKQ